MGSRVPLKQCTRGGNVDSRRERDEITGTASNKVSRHVMLSTTRDVITELELLDASSGGAYVIRRRHASGGVGQIMDSASWIGFCYHDVHWSFVKQYPGGS
jgi:hypothetical protein